MFYGWSATLYSPHEECLLLRLQLVVYYKNANPWNQNVLSTKGRYDFLVFRDN